MSKQLTEPQFEQALMLIADGRTIRQIADRLDFHPSTIQRHLLESGEEYEQAKERRRDLIRSERWERAFDRDDKWSAKFLDDLSLEQLPETRDARKQLNAPSPEEDRSERIAEALERFAAQFVSLATGERAALPPGEAER